MIKVNIQPVRTGAHLGLPELPIFQRGSGARAGTCEQAAMPGAAAAGRQRAAQ